MAGKTFQHTNFNISKIWGSRPSAEMQGGHATTSARRAGVKIGTPLTRSELEAQHLVNQIIQIEKAERKAAEIEKDPRSPFERRYDIRDGEAHITPEEFRELCFRQKFSSLKDRVGVIKIDDGNGTSIDFTFRKPNQIYSKELHVITLEDVLRHDVSVALRGHMQIVLRSIQKYLGLLEIRSIRQDLRVHSEMAKDQYCKEKFDDSAAIISENPQNRGNIRFLFSSAGMAPESLKQKLLEKIDVTVSTISEEDVGPLKIGVLCPFETVDPSLGNFIVMPFSRFARTKPSYDPSLQSKESFVDEFFNGAAGFILTVKGSTRRAVVLRHNCAPVTSRTPQATPL